VLLADNFVMTTAEGATYDKAQVVASVKDTSYKPDALGTIYGYLGVDEWQVAMPREPLQRKAEISLRKR
jgi:hypothetical protein